MLQLVWATQLTGTHPVIGAVLHLVTVAVDIGAAILRIRSLPPSRMAPLPAARALPRR